MCEKKSICNMKIDVCLRADVNYWNNYYKGKMKTIASCCGHGKYPKTIIVRIMRGRNKNIVFELFSKKKLNDYNPKFDKRHNIYYKKDEEGYYYIPELKAENIL